VEERYLYNLLYENVCDGTTRLYWARGLGFCPPHAWLLQAIEQQNWNDGMGVGILYEDLTERVVNSLSAYLVQHPSFQPEARTGYPFGFTSTIWGCGSNSRDRSDTG
jgi:hypothetical protein